MRRDGNVAIITVDNPPVNALRHGVRAGLMDVISLIGDIKKPTIAAVHGTPLGGGLELTMGCHFRVAAPSTRLGLPEIKLGLIPGAGGTQRLPRLVGIVKALPMILSGDPIPARDALAAGLVDEVIEGDLVQGAVAFARKVLAEKRPLVRVKDREEKLKDIRANPKKLHQTVAQHLKTPLPYTPLPPDTLLLNLTHDPE